MTEADDLQISLGESRTNVAVEERQPPAAGLSTVAVAYGDPEAGFPPVYIDEHALAGIEDHARSSTANEVGGVLLGRVCEWHKRPFVQIDDFLVAKEAGEQRASLTFTHDTWAELNMEREAAKPELSIVGWYHTHPNLGVFLSDKDRFIQRDFFPGVCQVALVVDPVCSERAFFAWSREKPVKLPGFYVFGDCSRSKPIAELVERLQPRQQPNAAQAQGRIVQPEIKIIYSEPGINLYYALPRFLRRLFGIANSQTAPRISIKSLIIVVLLGVIAYQFATGRAAPSVRPGYNASIHKKFAQTFSDAQDYEESVREWRRYLALRPSDVAARGDLLKILVHRARSNSYAWSAVDSEAAEMRRQANERANKGDFATAYRIYNALNASYSDSRYNDSAFSVVLGYVVNGGEKPAENAIATVKAQIPGIVVAVDQRSKQEDKSGRKPEPTKEDKR